MLTLRGHTDRVRRVAYSPDGLTLASCGEDGTVRLWDLAAGRARETLLAVPRLNVYDVAFSPDGTLLASASGDYRVRLWRLNNLKAEPRVLHEVDSVATSLAFAPDGRSLAAGFGNSNGRVVVWESPPASAPFTFAIDRGVWCVGYEPGGRLVAIGTASVPGEVVLWRPFNTVLGRFQTRTRVRSLAFSPDGQRLAASDGPDVKLWDVRPYPGPPEAALLLLRATLKGHSAAVYSLGFAPDGGSLASASHDGTVRVWDVARAAERACFDWGIGRVGCVAFAPDGMTLAAGGEKDIIVWDVDEGN